MRTGTKCTLADYHRAIAAGIGSDRQVELLRGEIVEMAPEGPLHADRYSKVARYLSQLLGDRAEIRPAAPITLPNQSEPQPDLAIVRPQNYSDRHPAPEDIFWLIEIANTSLDRDLHVKSAIYAEAGIPEYWIIDLRASKLVVMREPIRNGYRSQTEVERGGVYPLAFPELAIESDRLLSNPS